MAPHSLSCYVRRVPKSTHTLASLLSTSSRKKCIFISPSRTHANDAISSHDHISLPFVSLLPHLAFVSTSHQTSPSHDVRISPHALVHGTSACRVKSRHFMSSSAHDISKSSFSLPAISQSTRYFSTSTLSSCDLSTSSSFTHYSSPCRSIEAFRHLPTTMFDMCTAKTPALARSIITSTTQLSTPSETSPLVYQSAATYGDKIAICDSRGQHSYNQLLARSLALSKKLRAALPLPRSQEPKHVALLLQPTSDYVVGQWATWMAGHAVVPLCPQHPRLLLSYFLQDSCAAAVICCSSLQQLLPELPQLPTLHVNSVSQATKLNKAQQEALEDPKFGMASPQTRAMILYTSGTTGDPKGVVLTHGNLSASMQSLRRAWQYRSPDVLLHCLPLHHTHGIVNALMTPLMSGARVVMTNFEPGHIWSQLLGGPTPSAGTSQEPPREESVNVFMAVPTIYSKLLQYYEDHYATSQLTRRYVRATCMQNFRLMVSGSAALPESVLRQWRDATGVTLLERYGMTEIGMALTNPLLHGDRKPGFVGEPFPGVQVRIVTEGKIGCQGDCTGTKVTPGCEGQEGELQVKGPSVFRHYWGRSKATQKDFTGSGWFKTGDTAVYSDGAYKILGRTSVDIIKSGGFKVSALGVERVLLDHPHVKDVAVVGPPDRTWGQKISAVLVWSGPTSLDPALLKAWLKEHLPSYQVPTSYITVDELPRNNMGKVNKKQLIKDFFTRQD